MKDVFRVMFDRKGWSVQHSLVGFSFFGKYIVLFWEDCGFIYQYKKYAEEACEFLSNGSAPDDWFRKK